jgi:hypothetical protein
VRSPQLFGAILKLLKSVSRPAGENFDAIDKPQQNAVTLTAQAASTEQATFWLCTIPRRFNGNSIPANPIVSFDLAKERLRFRRQHFIGLARCKFDPTHHSSSY